MIEKLDRINGVNEDGDVVPLEDIYEKKLYDKHAVSVRTLALGSLVRQGAARHLQEATEHTVLTSESKELVPEIILGEAAQLILDAYITDSERLRELGASNHKSRIKLMQALARAQADRTVPSAEALDVLKKIKDLGPDHINEDAIVDIQPDQPSERHHYRDWRSAAANDFDD